MHCNNTVPDCTINISLSYAALVNVRLDLYKSDSLLPNIYLYGRFISRSEAQDSYEASCFVQSIVFLKNEIRLSASTHSFVGKWRRTSVHTILIKTHRCNIDVCMQSKTTSDCIRVAPRKILFKPCTVGTDPEILRSSYGLEYGRHFRRVRKV
jgi:hypothetical protein